MNVRRPARLAVLVAAALASGCAFTKEQIQIGYAAAPDAAQVPGASAVRVKVTVLDVRPKEAQTLVVSHKINGFGARGAEISADIPPPAILAGAVATELRARGYRVEDSGDVPLTLELTVFQHAFHAGFFAHDSEANVSFVANVVDRAGKRLFHVTCAGPFKSAVAAASGGNVREAYEGALRVAVRQLVDSPELQKALAAAAQPPRV
jgi:uncharacterized lipoprotein YajG